MSEFIMNLMITFAAITLFITIFVHALIKSIVNLIGDGLTIIVKAIRPGSRKTKDTKATEPKNKR